MISSDDIRWNLRPIHTRDADPTLYLESLTHDELLVWALDAQGDIETLRRTLHQSLALLADLTRKNDALRRALREGRR